MNGFFLNSYICLVAGAVEFAITLAPGRLAGSA
jgi:hypothetical protein